MQSDVPRLLSRAMAGVMYPLFGVSGAGAAVFLLGLSGGYPLGAASIGTLYRDGLLQKDEAEHLLAFCDNSGPAFAVGALGVGVFGSAGWGMLLWGIHAISAAAVGILFRRRTRGGEAPIKPPRRTPDFGAALGGAVTAAGQTILQASRSPSSVRSSPARSSSRAASAQWRACRSRPEALRWANFC